MHMSNTGMPPMIMISAAEYEAEKQRIIGRPVGEEEARKRRQGLVTAGGMARAMEVNEWVAK